MYNLERGIKLIINYNNFFFQVIKHNVSDKFCNITKKNEKSLLLANTLSLYQNTTCS